MRLVRQAAGADQKQVGKTLHCEFQKYYQLLAKRMLKYYRVSQCTADPPVVLGARIVSDHA